MEGERSFGRRNADPYPQVSLPLPCIADQVPELFPTFPLFLAIYAWAYSV
jgi:hypothetical protein